MSTIMHELGFTDALPQTQNGVPQQVCMANLRNIFKYGTHCTVPYKCLLDEDQALERFGKFAIPVRHFETILLLQFVFFAAYCL